MKEKYLKDYEAPLAPLSLVDEASRCLLCLDAPCSKACPAGTNPDRFIRAVRFRNFAGAAEIVRENNALGAICARVCPTEKTCQKGCSRSGIDRPIDIAAIQRFITDFEDATKMEILSAGKDNGKKVAIVGSGPSALQAAATLRKLGYAVTIYEKNDRAGGMLRFIPAYRLSNDVVDKEIARLERIGVRFILNTYVGKDVSLEKIEKENDAVILDCGLSYGKMLPMFKDFKNVELAVDFLKRVKDKNGEVALDKHYLVVGGGDVAMDVVTTLKLLDVPYVTDVVYETLDEFKASKKELDNARHEKVSIYDGYIPVSFDGKVAVFKHRYLENEVKVTADKVILAVGQYADLTPFGIELKNNEVNVDGYRLPNRNVFVAGDIAKSGQDKTVVGSIRVGKEVALAIDKYLGGK